MSEYSSREAIKRATARIVTDLVPKVVAMLEAQRGIDQVTGYDPAAQVWVEYRRAYSSLFNALRAAGYDGELIF